MKQLCTFRHLLVSAEKCTLGFHGTGTKSDQINTHGAKQYAECTKIVRHCLKLVRASTKLVRDHINRAIRSVDIPISVITVWYEIDACCTRQNFFIHNFNTFHTNFSHFLTNLSLFHTKIWTFHTCAYTDCSEKKTKGDRHLFKKNKRSSLWSLGPWPKNVTRAGSAVATVRRILPIVTSLQTHRYEISYLR